MTGCAGQAPVPMLLGPTASGKSAVAMALAERLPIEIVTVDSAQVYRGMDIGTAKPSAAERAAVPHHLIDIVDPRDSYSAARFVADARAAIAQIRARGRLPLLVGGTMLYARALVEGLHPLPGADAAVRRRLEDEARALGWPALHARLARIDPVAAARVEPGDAQRIQRALEVFEISGKPMSEWLSRPATTGGGMGGGTGGGTGSGTGGGTGSGTGGGTGSGTGSGTGERAPAPGACDANRGAPPAFVRIALEPSDRAVLHARIATRFRAMIAAGLVDEVRALRARGDLRAELPSMRCVGYRQVWAWLEAGDGPIGPMIEAGIAATRQLAKRQLTWLRAMPDRIVVDCLARDPVAPVLDALRRACGL